MGSVLLYLAIVVMWLGVLLPMWLRRDKHAIDDLYEDELAELAEPGDPADSAEPAADADTVVERPRAESSEASDAPLTVPLAAPVAEREAERSGGAARATESASGEGAPAERGATGRAEGAESASPTAAGAPRGPEDRAARMRRAERRRRAIIVARRRRRLLWSILLIIASTVTAAVRVVPWWAVTPSAVLLVGYLAVLRVAVRVDVERRELAAKARAERIERQRARRRAIEAKAREAEIIMLEARKRVQVFDQYSDQFTDRRAVGD